MGIVQIVHDLLAKGGLEKGWGGDECYKAVPFATHITESLAWIFLCFLFKKVVNGDSWLQQLKSNIKNSLKEYNQKNPKGNPYRSLEVFIGVIHLAMFIQLIYYKLNISALIYLLQPCHVILLLEGIALLNDGVLGVLITLFILPALIGTLLAMIFPETTGLDQPYEVEAYWLQHYLIQSVPYYLLLRKNALALKYANYKTVVAGLWILCLLHFSLLEVRLHFDFSFTLTHIFTLIGGGFIIKGEC